MRGTNPNLDYHCGLFSPSAFPRWGIIVRMRREAGERKLPVLVVGIKAMRFTRP